MGTLRDMAHSADDINYEARKRVADWSQRPAPQYIEHHRKQPSTFLSAVFCFCAAAVLVVTWVLFI